MNKKIIGILLCSIFVMIITNTSLAEVNLNINDDNLPPFTPRITIPNTITVGKFFRINATIIDPDGDDIYFRFNASILPGLPNFWFGPFPSGFIYTAFVKYRGPLGTYTIAVQAKDVYDAESEWTYVQFNVTKFKTYNNSFFRLLKNHSNFFPFLQKLLKRLEQ